ncbi:response regulator [Halobacillus litoralis]|uniref:response regulator n=1 Tax=Halobacillus litoralis TaxID=45668 RepID=UPI001CD339CC|nr:response regulator [Halobacillus litoralis]MCA0971047.1 response regulator [Halobacillus litoralis]
MADTILIVDDQRGIRLLLQEILKASGYKTLSAKTGKQACELADEHDIDLMVMDYNLPVMHGRDVLNQMKEKDCKFPVIIITGDSEESVAQEVDHLFVQKIVSKPFDIHNFQELVKSVLVKSET